MEVGSGVWIKNNHFDKLFNNKLWSPAIVTARTFTADDHVNVSVKKQDEEFVYRLPKGSLESDLIKIRGLQDDKSGIVNLNDLSFLNEPEILFSLEQRFHNNSFCTYYGPILLHVNPLVVTKGSDRDNILKTFSLTIKNQTAKDQEPWSVACKVFDEIMRDAGKANKLQIPKKAGGADKTLSHSILISGESGSGKTEISKEILKHMLVEAAEQKQSMMTSKKGLNTSSREEQGALLKRVMSTFTTSGIIPEIDDADVDPEFTKSHSTDKHESPQKLGRFNSSMMKKGVSTRTFNMFNAFQADILEKIVFATTLLDSMGTAMTDRNKNSSRYGKYLEVGFNKSGVLVGGRVLTYLLEDVRVSRKVDGESNFHIFYQIVRGCSSIERRQWGLNTDRLDAYAYLAGSAELEREIDDTERVLGLKESLISLEVDEDDINQFLGCIAGILHLGNVTFEQGGSAAGGCTVSDMTPINQIAKVFGVDSAEFASCLIHKSSMIIRGEAIMKNMTAVQAASARDSVAKNIYKRIFSWAVSLIDEQLRPSAGAGDIVKSVGVLDIFGFESFKQNGLDELCINYANEALQQHFNESVFKFELIEYYKEGIPLDGIKFKDTSKECVDLIGSSSGILKLLDDLCRLPNPSDKKFFSMISTNYAQHPQYQPDPHFRDHYFTVLHYAADVTYCSEGFTAKNIDSIPAAVGLLLDKSPVAMINGQGEKDTGKTRAKDAQSSKSQTLGAQFNIQLRHLIAQLRTTIPHFIRCIKPSERIVTKRVAKPKPALQRASILMKGNAPEVGDSPAATPGKPSTPQRAPFDPQKVTEQLRTSGVFHAIQAARSWFIVRLSHREFYYRFRSVVSLKNPLISTLPKGKIEEKDMKIATENLVKCLTDDPRIKVERKFRGEVKVFTINNVRVSSKRVFLTKTDYMLLEAAHSKTWLKASQMVNSKCAMLVKKKWFQRAKIGSRLIQRNFRGHRARIRVLAMKRHIYAVRSIQQSYRCHTFIDNILHHVEKMRRSVLLVQRNVRRYNAMQFLLFLKEQKLVYEQRYGMLMRARDYRRERRERLRKSQPTYKVMKVPDRRLAFNNQEHELIRRITNMINSKKAKTTSSVVNFSVKHFKSVLDGWIKLLAFGHFRAAVVKLRQQLVQAHEAMKVKNLIPAQSFKRLFPFSYVMSLKSIAKTAVKGNRKITNSHPVFKNIYRVTNVIEDIVKLGLREEKIGMRELKHLKDKFAKKILKHGDEYRTQHGTPYFERMRDVQKEIKLVDDVIRFASTLHKYYMQYVHTIVEKFGAASPFRRKFDSEVKYLLAFAELVDRPEPMHRSAMFLQVEKANTMDTCVGLPLPLEADEQNPVYSYDGVGYKRSPYHPGLDFAINSLTCFFREHSVDAIKLFKLAGTNAGNYGIEALFQASLNQGVETLGEIFTDPINVEMIDSSSFSSMFLGSLLAGAYDASPHSYLVNVTREDYTRVIRNVELSRVVSDELCAQSAFDFYRLKKSRLLQPPTHYEPHEKPGSGLNVLYFLPQMDEEVDKAIKEFLTHSVTVPEQIICSWLSFLNRNNEKFETLREGFTPEDYMTLKIPFSLPLGTAVLVYKKLVSLCEVMREEHLNPVKHDDILKMWYPILQEFYAEKRCVTEEEIEEESDSESEYDSEEEPGSLKSSEDGLLLEDGKASVDDSDSDSSSDSSSSSSEESKEDASEDSTLLLTNEPATQAADSSDDGDDDELQDDYVEPMVPAVPARRRKTLFELKQELAAGMTPDPSDMKGVVPFHKLYSDTVAELRRAEEDETTKETREEEAWKGLKHRGHHGEPREESTSVVEDSLDLVDVQSASSGSTFHLEVDSVQLEMCENPLNKRGEDDYSEDGGETDSQVSFDVERLHELIEKEDEEDEELKTSESEGTPLSRVAQNTPRKSAFFDFSQIYEERDDVNLKSPKYLLPSPEKKKKKQFTFEGSEVRSPMRPKTSNTKIQVDAWEEDDSDEESREIRKVSAMKVFHESSSDESSQDSSEETLSDVSSEHSSDLEESTEASSEDSSDLSSINSSDHESEDTSGESSLASDDAFEDDDVIETMTDFTLPKYKTIKVRWDYLTETPLASMSTIPEVARHFLMTLDFKKLTPERGYDASLLTFVGNSLSFLRVFWLRHVGEEQLKHLFAGFFEVMRQRKIARAIAATRENALSDDTVPVSSRDFKTKEIKLIGLRRSEFAELYSTRIVRRIRKVLGIRVTRVVVQKRPKALPEPSPDNALVLSAEGDEVDLGERTVVEDRLVAITDAENEVSSVVDSEVESELSYQTDADDLEDEEEVYIDDLEQYRRLKEELKRVVESYHTIADDQEESDRLNDCTVIKEVVKLAKNDSTVDSINAALLNHVGLMVLTYPVLATLGQLLAERRVFKKTNRLVHKLLQHSDLDAYLPMVLALLKKSPELLLLRDKTDKMMPADRVKMLPPSVLFKVHLLKDLINLTPLFSSLPFKGAAVGAEDILSNYDGEEELIIRAARLGLPATSDELKTKKYFFPKAEETTRDQFLFKCVQMWKTARSLVSDVKTIDDVCPALGFFKLYLRVLKARVEGGEMTQKFAEEFLFVFENAQGETVWRACKAVKSYTMMELLLKEWNVCCFESCTLEDIEGMRRYEEEQRLIMQKKYEEELKTAELKSNTENQLVPVDSSDSDGSSSDDDDDTSAEDQNQALVALDSDSDSSESDASSVISTSAKKDLNSESKEDPKMSLQDELRKSGLFLKCAKSVGEINTQEDEQKSESAVSSSLLDNHSEADSTQDSALSSLGEVGVGVVSGEEDEKIGGKMERSSSESSVFEVPVGISDNLTSSNSNSEKLTIDVKPPSPPRTVKEEEKETDDIKKPTPSPITRVISVSSDAEPSPPKKVPKSPKSPRSRPVNFYVRQKSYDDLDKRIEQERLNKQSDSDSDDNASEEDDQEEYDNFNVNTQTLLEHRLTSKSSTMSMLQTGGLKKKMGSGFLSPELFQSQGLVPKDDKEKQLRKSSFFGKSLSNIRMESDSYDEDDMGDEEEEEDEFAMSANLGSLWRFK